MNHLFGPYISVWMDVYLDDIVIYSDTLSPSKLHFLCQEMKILGRVVDSEGVRMDPDKVDSVLNWKAPTNKELLRGFLGSVGYLADDIAHVRIPMGILTSLTGSESSFKWDFTHQRAFDEIKRLVHAHRDHHRVPLDYSPGAPPIWLVTDGSHGGVAGVVSQGENFRSAKVAAFFSAKLNSAQMNYLLGCKFTWLTDHKGLVHLLGQKNQEWRTCSLTRCRASIQTTHRARYAPRPSTRSSRMSQASLSASLLMRSQCPCSPALKHSLRVPALPRRMRGTPQAPARLPGQRRASRNLLA